MDESEIKAISAAVTDAVTPLANRVSAIEKNLTKKNLVSRTHDAMKGYRTILVATALAVIPPMVDYFASPDIQTQLGISPRTAVILGGLFMILRMVTKGPVPLLKK